MFPYGIQLYLIRVCYFFYLPSPVLISVNQKMKFIPRPLMFTKEVITEDKCQIFGFSFVFERGEGMGMIRTYERKGN